MFISSFLFFLILIFYFFLPGRFFLRKINYSGTDSVSLSVISVAVGFSFFLFISYLLAWIKLEWMYLLFMIFPCYSELKRSRYKSLTFSNVVSVEILLIIFGSLAMLYLTALSGRVVDGNMLFFNVNAIDSIYHLSLIGNMLFNFPPTHPGLDGEFFRGYNFFYDFYLATFIKLFHFDRFDLFFRFSPLFIALLYGFSGLALMRFLKFSRYATIFFIFLLYFAQSGRVLFSLYKGDLWKMYDSRITQSFSNIVDPSVIVSIAFLFCGYILLFSDNKKAKLLSALLFGILPSLKIYTAILGFGALFVVGIYRFLKDRQFDYIHAFSIATIVAVVVYMPINFGVGSLIFQPFLLQKSFIEGNILFADYQWGLKYAIFENDHNFFRLLHLNILAFFLMHLPSLGVRIISIQKAPLFLKKTFYTYKHVFLLSAILLSFIIPTLFIQSFEVFVIVQLLWIGYILLLIPTADTLGQIAGHSTKRFLIIFILLIAVALPDIALKLQDYSRVSLSVNKNLLEITNYISKHLQQDDKIFVLNRQHKANMYKIPLISALSSHLVYYEPETIEFPSVQNEVEARRKDIDMYFEKLTACKNPEEFNREFSQFLQKHNQKYVLTLKEISCFKKMPGVKLTYESGEYGLYTVQ